MKKKIIITLMISFLLIGPHFTAAQQVWTFTGYGTKDLFHRGYGESSITVITNTDWVADRIDVITGPGGDWVIDQHIYSDPSGTNISRNALYIGPGSIETLSTYYGSNAPGGEDSITGIYLTGDTYGALIQNGTVEFNADFGGIRESVAVAGNIDGTYSVEQYGYVDTDGSADFTPQVDHGVSVYVSGDYYSGTISTFDFGSVPQPGPDTFHANTISWATGDGIYSFNAISPTIESGADMAFGSGNTSTTVDSDSLKVSAEFDAN